MVTLRLELVIKMAVHRIRGVEEHFVREIVEDVALEKITLCHEIVHAVDDLLRSAAVAHREKIAA